MKILEEFTRSKTGAEKFNEDCYLIGEDFVIVADGTTAKSQKFSQESDGRFVARFVCKCLKTISLEQQPIQILNDLNRKLAKELEDKNRQGDSASCSVLIYNKVRQEIISYGDCKYKIGGREYGFYKKSDTELAIIRSEKIKQSLRKGKTIEDIKNNDVGRKEIEQALKENVKKANQLGEYGYPVINGRGVIEEYINVIKVKSDDIVILSTDGYSKILSTLKRTEKHLSKIIKKDPLCIQYYLSTKGVEGNNESFDDRTYVKFKIE